MCLEIMCVRSVCQMKFGLTWGTTGVAGYYIEVCAVKNSCKIHRRYPFGEFDSSNRSSVGMGTKVRYFGF
jgi:hypothetical protein